MIMYIGLFVVSANISRSSVRLSFGAECVSLLTKQRLNGTSTYTALKNDNHDNNDMGHKTYAICGRKVYLGEGLCYGGRLRHRTCRDIAKMISASDPSPSALASAWFLVPSFLQCHQTLN